jgi:hypothetical protein
LAAPQISSPGALLRCQPGSGVGAGRLGRAGDTCANGYHHEWADLKLNGRPAENSNSKCGTRLRSEHRASMTTDEVHLGLREAQEGRHARQPQRPRSAPGHRARRRAGGVPMTSRPRRAFRGVGQKVRGSRSLSITPHTNTAPPSPTYGVPHDPVVFSSAAAS